MNRKKCEKCGVEVIKAQDYNYNFIFLDPVTPVYLLDGFRLDRTPLARRDKCCFIEHRCGKSWKINY